MSVRFTGEMMELNHLRGAPNTDIEVLGSQPLEVVRKFKLCK